MIKERELGLIEESNAYRHDHNIYISVAFSATLDYAKVEYKNAIPALKKMLERHCALSSVIVYNKIDDSYTMKLLESVDISQNVVFKQMKSLEELDSKVCQQLSTQFQNISTIPPWRLWVTEVDGASRITFFFHHTIFDGTSAGIFLSEFSDLMNEGLEEDTDLVFKVPHDMCLFGSIDELLGKKFDLKTPKPLATPEAGIWTGENVLDTRDGMVMTKCLFVVIDKSQVSQLVKLCKLNGASLTSLLVTVSMQSLNIALLKAGFEYEKLRCTIPRNLRPLVDLNSEMGHFVSSIPVIVKREDSNTWDLAGRIKSIIVDSISRGGQDSIAEYQSRSCKHRDYYTQRVGKKRWSTMEVSTILLKEQTHPWALKNVSFVQGSTSEGSPLTCSAISQVNGDLQMSIVWSSEIVSDEIVTQMHDEFLIKVKELCSQI